LAVERIRVEWDIDVTTPDNIADQWAEVGRNIGIAEDRARGLGQQFQQERGILGKLIDQEKKLRREREASNDPERIREINEELEEVRSNTEALTGTVKKQGNAWKKLAGFAAGALGAAAVVSFGKNAVQSAARFETLQISFETFLGSATEANKVLADLEKFSISTPFTPEQVQDAGRALLAFGEPVDTLKDSLKDIGDISAGTGKDFGELATLFGKARVAGTLYAEDINQLIEAGVPVLDEFASILGVSASEVKKLASEGKVSFGTLQTAFKNMTSEGGRFSGLTEKLSKSTAGLLSTIGGQIEQVTRSIGQFLLPAVSKALGFISRLFGGTQDVTQAFKDQIVELRKTQVQLGSYVGALGDANLSARDQETIIKRIKDIYPKFAAGVDIAKLSQSQLQAELNKANNAINTQIQLLRFQAGQAKIQEKLTASIEKQSESYNSLLLNISQLPQVMDEFVQAGELSEAQSELISDSIRKMGFETASLEEQINILNKAVNLASSAGGVGAFGQVINDLTNDYQTGNEEAKKYEEQLRLLEETAKGAGFDLNELAQNVNNSTNDTENNTNATKKATKARKEQITGVELARKRFEELQRAEWEEARAKAASTAETEKAKQELEDFFAAAEEGAGVAVPALDALGEKINNLKPPFDPEKIQAGLAMTLEAGQNISNLLGALSARRISDLDKEEQAALKRAGDNAAQREKIEEDFAKKREELQRKQAEQQKALAIFETIINTSAAIIKALALGNIPLSIFAGAQGALQLATIAAQPIPFYHGGLVTEGREDRDSVPAVLRKGEFVLTPDKYRAHKELIDRIHAGRALMLPSFGGGAVTVNTQEFNDKRLLKALETQTAELIRNRRAMTGNGPIGRRYNARRGY
jgi:tape measure domain-containing protein